MGEADKLMIVAGEASGDAHAAALIAALRERSPAAPPDFFGATGRAMRAAGVRTVVRTDELAITGLVEIAGALPRFWQAYRALLAAARAERPRAVILVDWPDFNLKLARRLHAEGFRVIYYISPQLWAWRSYRVRNIERDVDLLLAILPFEPEWYRGRGVTHVEYVGHPLTGEVRPRLTRAEFRAHHQLSADHPLIALLPGSRRKELERNLPPMLGAAALLSRSRPGAQFIIPLAPNRTEAEVVTLAAAARINGDAGVKFHLVRGETREALAAADAAAVASGTATLEAALTGTPLVVVYKESALNWHTLGRLIQTEHFGLVNLIAGERIAPELMQHDFTPERLALELAALLEPRRNDAARAQIRAATSRLGAGGASARAADAIRRALHRWGTGSAETPSEPSSAE